ncbi:hypothetical protein ACWDX6_28685 [Streptomyces sp. NPDC003027]
MRRTEYGASQAAKRLKVPAAAFRWARHTGLIPASDVSSSWWSRSAVEALDADAIRAAMPSRRSPAARRPTGSPTRSAPRT